MDEEHDLANDILELIEAHYSPFIKKDRKEINILKKNAEKIITKIYQMQDESGGLPLEASDEDKQNYSILKAESNQISV